MVYICCATNTFVLVLKMANLRIKCSMLIRNDAANSDIIRSVRTVSKTLQSLVGNRGPLAAKIYARPIGARDRGVAIFRGCSPSRADYLWSGWEYIPGFTNVSVKLCAKFTPYSTPWLKSYLLLVLSGKAGQNKSNRI